MAKDKIDSEYNIPWKMVIPILKSYGFHGLPEQINPILKCNRIRNCTISMLGFGPLPILQYDEGSAGSLIFQKRSTFFYNNTLLQYRTLLPFLTFAGSGLEPIWVTDNKKPVVSRHVTNNNQNILIGINIFEEIIRYRQGNHRKIIDVNKADRESWGYGGERPNYLFNDQIVPQFNTVPWADRLGYCFVEYLSLLSGIPLIEPLPDGSRGLVILTGDDDQAYLEKYDEQLKFVGNMPITYFLHPLTKHTSETLARLPRNVEIGVHPDALEEPDRYDSLCEKQTVFVQNMAKKQIRTVRNHGFLNDGYWGHLETWERCGLDLDVNLPGIDGTALNGSFLPFRVQKLDGTLSSHYSLLTAFGDGMVFALGMTDKQAARRIRTVARQIEKTNPGVLVFNLHPQNIDSTRAIHEEVVKLARRKGWKAMGLESYLNWLKRSESLTVEKTPHGCIISSTSGKTMDGIVLKIPGEKAGWRRLVLEPWINELKIYY